MITVSKHTVTTNILSINTWKYPNISTQTGIITGWGEKLNPQEKEGLKVDFIVKKPFKLSDLTKQISEAFAR